MIKTGRYIECNEEKFFIGDDVLIIYQNGGEWTGTIMQIYSDMFFVDGEMISYYDVKEIRKYSAE